MNAKAAEVVCGRCIGSRDGALLSQPIGNECQPRDRSIAIVLHASFQRAAWHQL
jgi:hypothetical protein